jgi:hypothetical protein
LDEADLRALPRRALKVPLPLDFVALDDDNVLLAAAAAAAAPVIEGLEEGSG